ncbi:MAG: outer membrane lipoprotein carrier protein LolA [Pseudomonadota bacterium]
MVTTLVSAYALILAFGPQMQAVLLLKADATTAAQPDIERIEPDAAAHALPSESETALVETATRSAAAEPAGTIVVTEERSADPSAERVEVREPETPPAAIAVQADPVTPMPTPTPAPSGDLSPSDWPTHLTAAARAMAAAKTAKGSFVQTNADGSVSTGEFALSRPGRMRFDYDDPAPILIVADGTTVALEDRELETIDRVPIRSTPLSLLLSSDLDFGADVDVLRVMQNADRIGIQVNDPTGELEGTLTMVFEKATYDLLGWLAIDGNLQTTVVDLLEVETNVQVDPRLFRLGEADDEEDER